MAAGEAAGQREDAFDVENGGEVERVAEIPIDQEVDETELGEDIAIDGLTGLYYWSPPGAVYFKTAAACHAPSFDFYGIFAVYTNSSDVDELWYLVVDGLSSFTDYGHVVYSVQIGLEDTASIEHVDCTTDGSWNYGVFDRLDESGEWLNPQWVRVRTWPTPRLLEGPYAMPDCGVPNPPYDPTPHGSSIAFHGGLLAVASAAPEASCGICFTLFNPSTGGVIDHYDDAGIMNGWTRSTDIEWNNNGDFLVSFLYELDDGDRYIVHTTLMADTNPITIHAPCGVGLACEVYNGELDELFEHDLELVYSPNTYNTNNRMIIQTDHRTIWINQNGTVYSNTGNPQAVGPWYDDRRASCESWSNHSPEQYRIAHTYAAPLRQLSTYHYHWNRTPNPPNETYVVRTYYYPDSCASSEGYLDAEILLISRSLFSGQERLMLYNMEPQE